MNRKIFQIEGRLLEIAVRKSRRAKSFRLQVSIEKGIELVIPNFVSFKEGERFIYSKKDWILQKVNEIELRKNKFYFFGREISVFQQFDMFRKTASMSYQKDQLIISTPVGMEIDVRSEYEKWLKQKAKVYIPKRTEKLAKQYDFAFNRISIRTQKTRWGSCSVKKTLSFNSRLMMLNKKLIDYVIIHELCHTKEMNHSPRFWCLVESILPDYYRYRAQLKKHNF